MKNQTNMFFHRMERLLMSRTLSKAFSWLLIVQIFVQAIAPYPMGLLIKPAQAQDITPVATAEATQSVPSPAISSTPNPSPTASAVVPTAIPTSVPTSVPTTQSPTPSLVPTANLKKTDNSVSPTVTPTPPKKQETLSDNIRTLAELKTDPNTHVIQLNTKVNKQTYTHKEKQTDPDEVLSLRSLYGKAFKVTEKDAFADPDFDKNVYEKLQKEKKKNGSAGDYVPPTNERIKDAQLGRKADPTPTPLPPYPGNGQRLSPNEKQKPAFSTPTEKKQEQTKKVTPTPTIFYPKEPPKDPNIIAEEPVIPPSESNKDAKSAEEGLYRFEVSAGEPIHFQDESGQLQEIDSTVVVDETDRYEFRNAAGPYTFRASATVGGGVEYLGKNGKICRFGLGSVEGVELNKDVLGVQKNNTITYPGIYPDADLQFTLTNSGVKTEVVTKKKSARKASYTFDLYQCNVSFREATVTQGSLGSSAAAQEQVKSDVITEAEVDESGEVISEKKTEIKKLTVKPNYSKVEEIEKQAIDSRTGLLDKVGSLIPVIGSGKKGLSDVGLNEELRIDPTLSDWIYESYIDRSGLANRADYTYAIGTIGGYQDSRAFYFFNRDSIPNAGFDPIGGYLTLRQLESNGDVYADVYATKFGTATPSENSIIGMYNAMAYPGVGSNLPDLVTLGSDGNISSSYADRTGVPQYMGGSINGDRRIHVPAWLFQRWKNAPCAAEGCWTTNEGLMVKAANNKGMRFKSGYDPDPNNQPSINVFMSSDTSHPDQGRPPTIPDIYMPRSGSYIQAIGGSCDESVSPVTGDCRTTTYVPLVTGAGDPDGWGPGDILGVQYSVWSNGGNSYSPFVYGTSPGITANLNVDDNIYYWNAYSKDRTNRVSASTPQQVLVTDTTPPSVPEVDALPTYTAGVGLDSVRQVDLVSPGSYDEMHVKLSTTFGTYYTIAYQAQYSTTADFTGNVYSLPWQSNNPNFNISAYGADQQSGTADDLVENTKYYFRIKAKDYYGNTSAWSNVTYTTLDSVAPAINSNTLSSQRASVSLPATWTAGYAESNPETATLRLSQANTQSAVIPDSLDKKPPQVFNLSNSNSFSGVSVRVGTVGYLYIQAGNLVRKVRASDGVVVAQIPVSGDPFAITYDGTYVYTLTMAGELKRIDPVRDVVFSTVQSAHVNATEVTAAEGFLWANRYDTNTITKINPSTGAVLCSARATSMGGGEIPNVKYINGKLWATDTASRHVFVINTANCQTQLLSAQIPSAPIDITADAAGYIWTTAIGGQLIKISPTNGAILTTLAVAGGFHTIDYDGVNFWMANIYSAYMAAISPTDGHVVETQVTANNQGYHAAFDGRYVWLVHYGGGSKVTRVDTGRWYENAAAANIIQQSIAIPDIVNARTLGSLPTGYAYRGTSVTVAGTKYVYAIQHGQGAVSKVRSSDAQYMSTIQLDKTKFASLASISSSGTTIYVASHEGWVGVIDAVTDTLTSSYQVATSSEMLMNVAEYGGDVWISYYGTPKVVKLDKATFAKKCEVSIAQFGSTSPISTHLNVIGGNLWTNHVTGGRLIRIGSDCKVAAVTPSQSGQASQMFTDGKYLWEISYYNARAYAYDLQTAAYVKEYPIASGSTAGAYDGKNYWITIAGNPEKIVKYDANFTELSRYSVTNGNVSSQDVLKDGKYLWFFNFDTGSLSRYDTSKDQPYAVIPSELTVLEKSQVLTNSGTVSVDFDTKTASGSAVPDGSYKASLILSDKAGQTSKTEQVMVVDNSAPTFSLSNSLASGWVTDSSVLLQGQLAASHTAGHEDFDVSSFEYRFGNSGNWTAIPFDSQNIFNTTITAPPGASTLTLRATDGTQNSTEQSYPIQTDTSAPQLSDISPVTLYAGTKPTLSYHVAETTAGSGVPYGVNPQGMKVQIQYTHNSTAVIKTLVDNGVIGDTSLASTLTCVPTSGSTTSTDNGIAVASAVDCSMPILSDLPEALYNLVVWTKDFVGHEVTDYSAFQIKNSIYHTIQSPEADAHIASGAATLQGTTSRGAQLTIANQQLAESRTFTLDPTLAGTGSDSFIVDNFVVTCGELRDTDNNPATPDEEVCGWHTRVASAVTDTDVDTANTLTVTAADGYGNDTAQTIRYVANVYGINLTLQPANSYFSPNGDGQLDGVVFNTTIDAGATVTDWTITIKDSNNAIVRTLSGTGSLPTTITWDGNDTGAAAVVDGEYTWSATVHANNLTFSFPSAQNASTATLTAKSSITDQVLMMSPSTGYVTSAGVVAVAGLAPATVAATDLSQNKLKGSILVRICVDTVGTSADCDYTANANVDGSGNFSTLVVLPKDVANETATHTITAYAYDEYGNSTNLSNSVTVTTDTRGSILSASSTTLTPASTSDAYTAYQAGTTDINTVANAWVRVSVSQYTQYVKLSYAAHTIRDGLYQATGELTTIGYINNQVESSTNKNPDSDSRVKHIQDTNPITTDYSQAIANTCQTASGCEWYVRLPVAPTQAGVYDIVVQAVKGEAVSEASVGYRVDGSSPNSPTVAMTDQVVGGTPVVAYVYNNAVQVRSPRVRLYGATTAGSKLRVRIGTSSKQAVDMYVNNVLTNAVSIGAQGVYEVDADISDFLAEGTAWDLFSCSARDTNGNCELGTFVLTPQSYEVDGDGNEYHQVDGESMQFTYDAQPPAATEISATTTGVNVVSPWGTSGSPIHYDVTTSDAVRYAQIKRPDTFTRIFDTNSGNSFTATFSMSKSEATSSATMLDREGYFNPVITLVDYAGNTASYDAANYASYSLGDFRGRIDDSIPLTSRMPFATWGEGGKTAHDAPLTQDSVYINTLSQGFVTRNKTIRIKALAERGQRVQFKINGENQGGLIDVTDQNCVVPDANTPSSESPDTVRDSAMTEDLVWNAQTGEYMLPTADRTSANGLTVRSTDQCEVSTTYTFPGDGTTHQDDGTPTEAIDAQLTSVDKAGNLSNVTAPIKIYYDTFAPKEPEAILYQDDIGVRGERMGYYDITMTSPNGTVTTTGEGVLDGDGDSMEIVHKIFTDEWGIFTIVVHTYDAAGNVSTTTRTIERKPDDPDPADGIGGGSGSSASFAWPNVSVYVYSNGTYAETGATVATPKNVLGSHNDNSTFNIQGNALSVGHPATIKVTYQSLDKVIEDRCKNYGRFASVCIGALQGQVLRTSIDKSAKVSESYVRVVDHDTSGFLDEFANSASFSKSNIPISSISHKIRAASKIRISGTIAGTNFSNSNIHQGYSTDPITLVSASLSSLNSGLPYSSVTAAANALAPILGLSSATNAYSILNVSNPKTNPSIPSAMKTVFGMTPTWDPIASPGDYMQCVAFVVHSYAITNSPYTGPKGNANQWSTYTNYFDIHNSGQSTVMPAVDDLAVWDRNHIGVIVKVDVQNKEITIAQANASTINTKKTYNIDNNGIVSITGADPFDHWLKRK